MNIRHPFKDAPERLLQDFGKEDHTIQSEAALTNPRAIIERFDKTGVMSHVATAKLRYGEDYTEVNEYQDALNLVAQAQSDFMGLPADKREYFQNDPGLFMEAITDPSRVEEMANLGIMEMPVGTEPLDTTVPTDTGSPQFEPVNPQPEPEKDAENGKTQKQS